MKKPYFSWNANSDVRRWERSALKRDDTETLQAWLDEALEFQKYKPKYFAPSQQIMGMRSAPMEIAQFTQLGSRMARWIADAGDRVAGSAALALKMIAYAEWADDAIKKLDKELSLIERRVRDEKDEEIAALKAELGELREKVKSRDLRDIRMKPEKHQ